MILACPKKTLPHPSSAKPTNIMDSDDEAPPDLVETGPDLAEEIVVKVPITIVTGIH